LRTKPDRSLLFNDLSVPADLAIGSSVKFADTAHDPAETLPA